MTFYRVFPWIESAEPTSVGGALFVPPQGTGRIDNPERYAALYASDSPAGAVAEVFNRNPYRMHWTPRMLRPRLSGSVTAIAELVPIADIALCDLDDPQELHSRGLRPSFVVTRDRGVTRAWSLALFAERRYAGVRWWSYHDARWGVVGFWNLRGLSIGAIRPLALEDPALRDAARVLSISTDRRRTLS